MRILKNLPGRIEGFIHLCCSFILLFFIPACKFDPCFSRPNLIAVTKDSRHIVIYDSNNSRLLITDRDYRLEKTITHPDFYYVWGLTVTDSNEIIVSNEKSIRSARTEIERKASSIAQLLFFDMSGNFLREFRWEGKNSEIKSPSSIRQLEDGTFLLVDFSKNQVIHLSSSGRLLSTFGEFGYEEGKLYYPNDAIQLLTGDYLVVETYNSRLQVFSSDGKYIRLIAGKGTSEGQVMFPQYITMDKNGNLYVTEMYTMRITCFDRALNFKNVIDPRKAGVKKELIQLFGLAWASSPDRLLVVDSLNSSIYEFNPDGVLVRTVTGVTR